MRELIEQAREYWNDKEKLQQHLLTITRKQLELADNIAQEEATLNSAFINEREVAFKGTDSMAKARAKMYVGTNKTKWEYQFEVLNNLINIVTLRVSQIDQ